MSGVEVVAAVAGIVSAFVASVGAYRGWQARRARPQRPQHQNLEISLSNGGKVVQKEYDAHFARLGKKFAVGDATARSELNTYVITLQHLLITLLSESNSTTHIMLPNLPNLISTSEESRAGVVTILAEQYQRMSQAAPIRRSLMTRLFRPTRKVSTMPTTQTRPNLRHSIIHNSGIQRGHGLAERKHREQVFQLGRVQAGLLTNKQCSFAQLSKFHERRRAGKVYRCNCGVEEISYGDFEVFFSTDKEKLRIDNLAILQSHITPEGYGREELWFCKMCESATRFTFSGLMTHLRDHSSTEIQTTFFGSVVKCSCLKKGGPCEPKCKVERVPLGCV